MYLKVVRHCLVMGRDGVSDTRVELIMFTLFTEYLSFSVAKVTAESLKCLEIYVRDLSNVCLCLKQSAVSSTQVLRGHDRGYD